MWYFIRCPSYLSTPLSPIHTIWSILLLSVTHIKRKTMQRKNNRIYLNILTTGWKNFWRSFDYLNTLAFSRRELSIFVFSANTYIRYFPWYQMLCLKRFKQIIMLIMFNKLNLRYANKFYHNKKSKWIGNRK